MGMGQKMSTIIFIRILRFIQTRLHFYLLYKIYNTKTPITALTLEFLASILDPDPVQPGVYAVGLEVRDTGAINAFSISGSDHRALQKVRVFHMYHGLTGNHPRPQGSVSKIMPEARTGYPEEAVTPRVVKHMLYPLECHGIRNLTKIDFATVPQKNAAARNKIKALKKLAAYLRTNIE